MNRLRSIVTGIDFTPCSESALRQSVRIANWNRADLHVVHVIATDVVAELEAALGSKTDDVRAGLIDDTRREWTRFTSGIAEAANVPVHVEIGHPVATLLARVQERSAGLLVLGVSGTSPADRGAGTVATACVRKCRSPVLLVHQGHGTNFHSVVACVDFSDTSRKALEQAVRIALQEDSKLFVLHVFDGPWRRLHYRAPTPAASPDFQKQFIDGLRGRLESFCQPLATELGFLRPEYFVHEHTSHGEGITQFVRQNHVDLVVLGTRGRTNLRYMMWGRTAERVVREAPCSILAVKPDESDVPDTGSAAAEGVGQARPAF